MFRPGRSTALLCAGVLLGTATWANGANPREAPSLPDAARRCQSSPYPYITRGDGASLRSEGVKSEPYAGSLTLLSFTVGEPSIAATSNAERLIRVTFSSPGGADVALRVRELQSKKSYLLEARHPWRADRNAFAWPTNDVLAPLGVELTNLGVVVGSNPGKTGVVVPARFTGAVISGPEPLYRAVVRSKYTCAPMLAVLSRVSLTGAMQVVARQSHRDVAALTPKVIGFDTTTLADGPYSLKVSCQRKGSGAAAGVDSYQEAVFDFVHDAAFGNEAYASAVPR
jgi:hypothetical protein